MNNSEHKRISIIVPAHNEEENIKPLVGRIHNALTAKGIVYEIIFVNDYSTDNTAWVIRELAKKYPVILIQKQGKKGKSYSIREGAMYAQYEAIGMIDADLQYPPEVFSQMLEKLNKSDVIVANRKRYKDSPLRKLFSKTFRLAFGTFLFGLKHDIQSGLKVFKKEVFETVKFQPASPWTFDLEFLHRAKQAGFRIEDLDITFSKRENGKSKVRFINQTLEIGLNALRVKAKRIHPASIPPVNGSSMVGAGIGYKKKKYITHTTIPHHLSALKTITKTQKLIVSLILFLSGIGLFLNPLLTLQVIVGVLSTIYFADVIFNLFLIVKSLSFPREVTSTDEEINEMDEDKLPVYTILCPLYKEAQIIPQFLDAISKISWPKEKLDVVLLLEEDDKSTIEAASEMNLPSYVRTLVVPHSIPKTKPKACNYGLAHAKGEYLVIYDAEDVPDPFQLKKAYLGFQKVGKDTICLQAKLNYYNPHQNLLTRFFTAEYSLWFDITLPGLQSINTALPLGGTSNHFKTESLRSVQGWDPFNVTEDADLGVRLFKKGYKTAMFDSVTLEEANSKVWNWFRQRSRWLKGYMQTYLVHTRGHGSEIKRQTLHSLIFQLVIGGKIAFVLINPILWIATFSYFALYAYVGPQIEALYPSVVFYMAIFSLVLGNFLFLYYYMIGVAKKGQWNLVKFVFLIPIYWLMISFAALIALYQLIVKPHYWEKTVHGHHLDKVKTKKPAEKEEKRIRPSIDFPDVSIPTGLRRSFSLSSEKITSGISLVILASLIGNAFNLLYNVYLVRVNVINIEEFGLIALIGSIMTIAQIPLSGFSRTIAHRSAYLYGRYDTPIKSFWAWMRKTMLLPSVALTAIWIAAIPLLQIVFHTDSVLPFILLTPVWSVVLLSSVDSGFLNGNLRLKTLGLMTIAEVGSKFLITVVIVELNLVQYIYLAIPGSVLISFLMGWLAAKLVKSESVVLDEKIIKHFPKKFYASSILAKLSTIAFLNVDLVMAKHFLPPQEAGQYAVLSLVGKMVYFLGTLFTQFINPYVSRDEGAGKNSKHVFSKLIAGTTIAVVVGTVAFGILGNYTVPLILGDKSLPILSLLPLYSVAMGALAIGGGIVSYHQSRQSHLFAGVSFLFSLFALGSILYFHDSIETINTVIVISGISYFLLMLSLHFVANPLKRFISDFASLFAGSTETTEASDRLRILILNWRDIKHGWSGGAESYVHELAKRWVKEGHEVSLFCGNDGKSKRNGLIDGVKIVRRGGNYTVYLWAFIYYALRFRNKFDVIIDSENGIPFFAPLYARKPVFLLIHHIHQDVFTKQLRFPVSNIAAFLEASVMPKVYRHNKIITVSESSKEDILKIGFGKSNDVSIVHPGIETSLFKKEEKTQNPLFSYVGRLKSYKNIDIAIRAFSQVIRIYPKSKLLIIGEGETLNNLKKLAIDLDIRKNIVFTGRVSNERKARLLSRSWVVLQPSMVEGWGITVIESNASGTPVIASNVNGLKDSVLHGQTGTLVPVRDVDAFAHAMIDFIIDEKYREEMSKNAYAWSANFTWEDSARKFFSIISSETERNPYTKAGRFGYMINRITSLF